MGLLHDAPSRGGAGGGKLSLLASVGLAGAGGGGSGGVGGGGGGGLTTVEKRRRAAWTTTMGGSESGSGRGREGREKKGVVGLGGKWAVGD